MFRSESLENSGLKSEFDDFDESEEVDLIRLQILEAPFLSSSSVLRKDLLSFEVELALESEEEVEAVRLFDVGFELLELDPVEGCIG